MRFLLSLLVLAVATSAISQEVKDPMPKQSAYLELFGAGLTYTVNYERFVYREPKFAVGIRAGAGITPSSMTWAPYSCVIGVTALFGTEGEHFEAGAYRAFLYDRFNRTVVPITSAMLGYRYQPRIQGPLFKFGFAPFFARTKNTENKVVPLIPYLAFGVGYAL
jgi:hypothetical protein